MKSKLALSSRLLAIIGRRIPTIYDVIPRGPQRRYAEVALNPQPLPPHELGAAVAGEIIHAVWLADKIGHDIKQVLADLDDWCPTVPRRLKFPPWWPPVPEPDPHPDWFVDYHLGFAARLAAVSMHATRNAEALEGLIERSLSAIEVVSSKQFEGQMNVESATNGH